MEWTTRYSFIIVLLCLTLNFVFTTTVSPIESNSKTVTVHSNNSDSSSHKENTTDVHHHGNKTDHEDGKGHHNGNDLDHHGNDTGSHSNKTGHHDDKEHDEGHGHGASSIHLVEFNADHVKGPLVFGLVVIIAGLSKIGFHHADFLSTKVPESCILILIGVVLGAIIQMNPLPDNPRFNKPKKKAFENIVRKGEIYCFSDMVGDMQFFQPHEFFLFLLPPIILEAAYSLHDRTFTENIGSILMFSVVGTIFACFLIGLSLIGLGQVGAWSNPGCTPVQILVFSSLIVAVDPVAVLAIFQEVGVNKMLYFLVFGESLLNDGVTVVIYNVMQTYNRMDVIGADQIVLGILKFFVVVFGGMLIGTVCGALASFITKYTNSVKVVEPIIIFGFAYQSYILAELFHFSGIISIIVCGLIQVQYAFNNITNKSKLCVKFFVKVISNTCEIIIFLFLGLKVVIPNHYWNTGFVVWTIVLCIVFRFIITYLTSFLINKCDTYRVRKIKMDEMFMISYGGLRGAVCFSLVALLDEKEFGVEMKNMFVTTTLFVIFFTVFIQGGTIKFLVRKMRISLQRQDKSMIMYEELNQHVSDHLMAGIEEVVGFSGKFYVMEKFDRLDNKFIRPILLRDRNTCAGDEISNYYQRLLMKEHYKNLKLSGAVRLPKVSSSIRQVDSSACLKVMEDEFETRQLDKEEKLKERRSRLISTRSMRSAEGQGGDLDLKKVFRDALFNSKNKNNLKFHDKNFIMDEGRHFVGHLRTKHKKNQRLSTIQSEDGRRQLDRAFSWDENDAAAAVRRTSEAKINALERTRCYTMDMGRPSPQDHDKPKFGLVDPLLEADEEVEESEPLINSQNSVFTSEDKSNSVEGKRKVSFEGHSQGGNATENAGKSPKKAQPIREDSHGSELIRQNAVTVNDADIALQDMGRKSEHLDRQKSV